MFYKKVTDYRVNDKMMHHLSEAASHLYELSLLMRTEEGVDCPAISTVADTLSAIYNCEENATMDEKAFFEAMMKERARRNSIDSFNNVEEVL